MIGFTRIFGSLLLFRLRLVIGYGGDAAQLVARELHAFLPVYKYQKWISWRRSGTVVLGQDFEKEIDKRIARADALLMIWTSESPSSDEAKRELKVALEVRTEILPFVERGAQLPPEFNGKQNVTFDPGDASSHFMELEGHLKRIRKTSKEIWDIQVEPA
jgi:hypothetical protein